MKKLYRNEDTGKFMGVLEGLAEYIEADSAIVRLTYTIVTILTGFIPGMVLYWVACICIPENPELIGKRKVLSSFIKDLQPK